MEKISFLVLDVSFTTRHVNQANSSNTLNVSSKQWVACLDTRLQLQPAVIVSIANASTSLKKYKYYAINFLVSTQICK